MKQLLKIRIQIRFHVSCSIKLMNISWEKQVRICLQTKHFTQFFHENLVKLELGLVWIAPVVVFRVAAMAIQLYFMTIVLSSINFFSERFSILKAIYNRTRLYHVFSDLAFLNIHSCNSSYFTPFNYVSLYDKKNDFKKQAKISQGSFLRNFTDALQTKRFHRLLIFGFVVLMDFGNYSNKKRWLNINVLEI